MRLAVDRVAVEPQRTATPQHAEDEEVYVLVDMTFYPRTGRVPVRGLGVELATEP